MRKTGWEEGREGVTSRIQVQETMECWKEREKDIEQREKERRSE